jgi:hypothetical protein
MDKNLLEATPERRREVAESGVTPRTLLRRWAYLAYAVAKLLAGAVVVSMIYFFAFGALVVQTGLLTGSPAGIVFLLGFVPVGRLFFSWAFPVRY